MAQRNLYQVLGVPRTASDAEIRKAYREIARSSHPDRNPGNRHAEERFKEASYAKEVLLNRKKRQLYDEFGEAGLREGFDAEAYRSYNARHAGGRRVSHLEDLFNSVRPSRTPKGADGSFQDFVNPGVVESIFGGRKSRTKRDLISDITVSFVESVRGAEKELAFTPPGENGRERVLRVRIPAGVTPGGRVRLRGHGAEGGDLVLHVHVSEHPYFTREGDNLHLTLPVTLREAYYGAKITVPTPEGDVSLAVPPGIQSGTKLRLRGKGVTRPDHVGDLIVTVQLQLPSERSEQVAGLVNALESLYAASPRSGIKF